MNENCIEWLIETLKKNREEREIKLKDLREKEKAYKVLKDEFDAYENLYGKWEFNLENIDSGDSNLRNTIWKNQQ